MKLTYTKVGDYLFPNLTIKNQKYKIYRWIYNKK